MKKVFFLCLSLLLIFSFSCSKKSEKSKVSLFNLQDDSLAIVTNKIMYDVPIVNLMIGADRSKNNPDWFWENLPSPDGDNFIASLLDDVKNARIPIYEYDLIGSYDSLVEIPESDLDDFLADKLFYRYETFDSLKQKTNFHEIELNEKNVRELRFLEEWYIKDGEFCKRVVAFAPFFSVSDPNFAEELNIIAFWVRLKR